MHTVNYNISKEINMIMINIINTEKVQQKGASSYKKIIDKKHSKTIHM